MAPPELVPTPAIFLAHGSPMLLDDARWVQELRKDVDALLDYRNRAPGVELALPTQEHFVPVITALGAAPDPGPVSFPITGFVWGPLTRRSVEFG